MEEVEGEEYTPWEEDKLWRRCNVDEEDVILKEKDDGEDVPGNQT